MALNVIFAGAAVLQSVLFLILVFSVAGTSHGGHHMRVFRGSGSVEVCFVLFVF